MALDSRSVRAMVALSEELHFGRAADRLGIAQSALSGQIRRLEDSVGGRLFERGRRSAVRLTPAGVTFLVEAQRSLDSLDRAERIGRQATRGEAGIVRLGYVFSAATSGILSRALAAVRTELPAIIVETRTLQTPDQIEAIADYRLNCGFVRPRPVYPAGIFSKTVHREPFVLALEDQHPLARNRAIEMADLANETFIVPRFGDVSGFNDAISRLVACGGFPRPAIVDTGDFVTAASMASGGYGVVLAPRSLSNLLIEGLAYRDVQDFQETIDLALVWTEPSERVAQTIIAATLHAG